MNMASRILCMCYQRDENHGFGQIFTRKLGAHYCCQSILEHRMLMASDDKYYALIT